MSEAFGASSVTCPEFRDAVCKFREEIGAVLPNHGGSQAPSPRPNRRQYTRILLTALCILLLIPVAMRAVAQRSGPDKIPADLIGVWATNDPRYAGRHLELSRDSLILRATADEATAYSVRRVAHRQTPGGAAYAITGSSELHGEYTLTLDYSETEKTIALGSPADILWSRTR